MNKSAAETTSTVNLRWFDESQGYKEETKTILGNPVESKTIQDGVVATLYNVMVPYSVLIEDSSKGTVTLHNLEPGDRKISSGLFAREVIEDFPVFTELLEDELWVRLDRGIDSGYVAKEKADSFASLPATEKFRWREAYEAAARTITAIKRCDGYSHGIEYNPQPASPEEFSFCTLKTFSIETRIINEAYNWALLDIAQELSIDYFLYGKPSNRWNDEDPEDFVEEATLDTIEAICPERFRDTYLTILEDAMDTLEQNWPLIDHIAKTLLKKESIPEHKMQSLLREFSSKR